MSISSFLLGIFLIIASATTNVIGVESDDFKCTELGTFPKPKTNCKGYIVCYQRNDDEFASMDVMCPENTVYNEYEEVCVNATTYKCKDIVLPNEEKDPCNNSPGRYPKNGSECKQYYLCIQKDNQISHSVYDCPSGASFDPEKGRCIRGYECPKEVVKDPCNNTEGRFIKENTGCKSYYLCLKKDGKITPTVYDCPINALFSIERGRCISNYVCPSDSQPTTTSTTTTTTTESPQTEPSTETAEPTTVSSSDPSTTEANTTTEEAETATTTTTTTAEPSTEPTAIAFNCTKTGYFVNRLSKDCSTYIQCIVSPEVNSTTLVACPSGTIFSYQTLQCEESSICPFSEETNKVCKNEPGRFENKDDKLCKSYILCVLSSPNPNGETFIVSKKYDCPGTRIFSSILSRCVNTSEYECPYKETITTSTTQSSESSPTTSTTTTSGESSTTISSSTNSPQTTENQETTVSTTAPTLSTSTSASTSEPTDSTSSTSTITTTTTKPSDINCNFSIMDIKTGFYKDPTNVCSYISCVHNDEVLYCGRAKCDSGQAFSDTQKQCVTSDLCRN